MSAARSRASGRGWIAVAVAAAFLIPVTEAPACTTATAVVCRDAPGRGIGRSLSAVRPEVTGPDAVLDLLCAARGAIGGRCPTREPTGEPTTVPTPSPTPEPAGPIGPVGPVPPAADPSPIRSRLERVPTAPTVTPGEPTEPDAPPGALDRTPPRVVVVHAPPAVRVVAGRLSGAAAALAGAGLGGLALAGLLLAAARRRARRTRSSPQYRTLTKNLLANLSHELYTPLTPVKGYAGLLRDHNLPPAKVREIAGQMLQASARLEHVLDVLVSYAAVESGTGVPRRDPVDVGSLVRGIARDAGTGATHPIRTTIARDLPRVVADGRLIRLALEQLLDNAVKFSPGGGRIRIDVAAGHGSAGRVLRIRVLDRGIGMTASQRRGPFDAFRQGDASSTRRFGGLGIGLAFADRVARLHGGCLSIASRPGRGCVATLEVPLVPADRPVPVAA